MNASANARLQKIAVFVQDHLEEMARLYPSPHHNPLYRWEHTRRVAQYGQQIAAAEGLDVEAVVAGCLLHDLAHFDPLPSYKDHGRAGARISRPLLQELGYAPERVENICFAIAVHVDGKADFEHPYTVECSAVSDADNIDRFGAYRILQWCVEEMHDMPRLAEKLRPRIAKLQSYLDQSPLETASGRQLFEAQLQRQIAVFQALVAEHDLTQVPEL